MNYRTVELRVQLAFTNAQESAKNLRVELMDTFGVSLQELRSDQEGKVTFRNVPPGDYRIVVKGDGIEESRGTIFSIYGFSSYHSEMVQLFAKRDAGSKRSANAPVSIASLKVPQKAREEFEKGSEAMAAGRNDEGRKHFERAIQIYPDYSGAYNNLGVIHMQEGQKEAGRIAFQRALELDPDSPSTYMNLGRIFAAEKNFAEVDRLLTRYVSMNPTNPEALLMLSKAQALGGKLDEALANCRKVHALPHKEQAQAHLLAARILHRRKLAKDALREYTLFLDEAPNDPNAPEAKRMVKTLVGPHRTN